MSLTQMIAAASKAWHGTKLGQPDWGEHSHSSAFTAQLGQESLTFHLILNAYKELLESELPPSERPWRRWIDTSLQSPDDIVEWQKAPKTPGGSYRATAHTVVVLYS